MFVDWIVLVNEKSRNVLLELLFVSKVLFILFRNLYSRTGHVCYLSTHTQKTVL